MHQSYTIRLMQPHERAEVRSLMERSFDAYLRPIFFIHDASTLVAVKDGTIVGGVNMDIYPLRNGKIKMGYIGWLYTDSSVRGAGLGSKLFEHALQFLTESGCTDAGACVEGDNPSSFKQMAHRGFNILTLGHEISRFRLGFFKVCAHASRFLDMGYFFWHRRLDTPPAPAHPLQPSASAQWGAVMLTLLGCLLSWLLVLLRRGQVPTLPLMLVPLVIVGMRNFCMFLAAPKKVIFLPWDTAWFSAIVLPAVLGWPFPVPGSWYIRGDAWSLRNEEHTLAHMGICGVLSSMVILATLQALQFFGFEWSVLVPAIQYSATLLVLDTLCFFYPFCGFNGSRIMRTNKKTWIFLALLTVLLLLV